MSLNRLYVLSVSDVKYATRFKGEEGEEVEKWKTTM